MLSRWRLVVVLSAIAGLLALSSVGVFWEHYTCSEDVRALMRYGDSLFLGTYGGGLVRLYDITNTSPTFDSWTTEDGLPTNDINALSASEWIQMSPPWNDIHAIWLGTQGHGLVAFDADNYTVLQELTTADSDIPSNNVQALATEATYYRIWVGTDEGLALLEHDYAGTVFDFTVFDTSDGLPSDTPNILSAFDEGPAAEDVAWFGTWGDGVIFTMPMAIEPTFDYWDSTNCDLDTDNVIVAMRDAANADMNFANIVFLGTDDGLYGLWVSDGLGGSEGTIARYPLPSMAPLYYNTANSDIPSDVVLSLQFDDDNNLWVGTDQGVAYWYVTGPSDSTITSDADQLASRINAMVSTGDPMTFLDTVVYFGTNAGLWDRYWDTGSLTWTYGNLDMGGQIAGNYVPSVHSTAADSSYNNSWYATDNGASWFDGTDWFTYDVADGFPSATITAIRPNGAITWAGTDQGLVRLNTTTGSVDVYDVELSGTYIYDVEINGSDVIVGTDNGVSIISGTHPNYFFTTALAGLEITSIAVDGDGELWFGTYGGGLFRGTDGSTWYDTFNSFILSSFVNDVAALYDDVIYVATDNGVSRLYKGPPVQWRAFQTPDLLSNDVRCIAVDPQGLTPYPPDFYPYSEHVLFGTDMGVSRFFWYVDSGHNFEEWSSFVHDGAGAPADSIRSDNVFAAHVHDGRIHNWSVFPNGDFTVSLFGHDTGASLRAQGLPMLSNPTTLVSVEEDTNFTLNVYYEDAEGQTPYLNYVYLSENAAGPYDSYYSMNYGGNPGTWWENVNLPRGRYFLFYYFVDDDYTIVRLPNSLPGYYDGIYCHDEYEPDYDCTQANAIVIFSPGEDFSDEDHSLIYDPTVYTPDGPDQDWFEMQDLVGGDFYHIWTHGALGHAIDADTDISVYGGTCPNPGLPIGGAVGNGGAADLWWECPADGDYYMAVKHGAGSGLYPVPIGYSYDVSAVHYEVDQYEEDDVCDDAGPIAADCISQTHTLAPHDDVDWLTFVGLAGVKYRVLVFDVDPNVTDADLYVYSGDCGNLVLVDSDTSAGLGLTSSVEFQSDSTQTYYVEVRHHDAGEIGWYYKVAVCSELWPMLGCDKGHRGYMDADGPTTEKVEWARAFGQYHLNKNVSIDQTARLFVAATDGTIYAVLPNGRLDWSYALGEASLVGPVIDHGGNVVVPVEGGSVVSLTAPGDFDWQLGMPLPDEITAPPTIGDDGFIYVGCANGYVYPITVDGMLGSGLQGTAGSPIVGSPALDDAGRLYFTAGDDPTFKVFCYDGTSLEWASNAVPEPILTAAPTLSHDESELYVGTEDGVLYALHTTFGTANWNFPTGGPISASPAVHPDAGLVYIASEDGTIYCVDPAAPGTAIWEYTTGGAIKSSPVVDMTGRCYFGSDDGFFYCLEPDGSLLWSYDFGVPVDSSPSIDSYGFVYITVEHELFVFDEWVPDPRAPESWCSCPAKVTEPPIPVTWTSRDNKSGVKHVKLYYQYSPGDAWGPWAYSGHTGHAETGTFDFVPPDGEGNYGFFTIAEDYVGNTEATPATADCRCLYSTDIPQSSCSSPAYDDAMPIPVAFTSQGVNPIRQTVLWFRYNGGDWTCSGQAKQGTSGTIYFAVNLGDGTYDFYTVAVNEFGNSEQAPGAETPPDTTTVLDTIRPVSSCWADGSGYTTNNVIPITFKSFDERSGVKETVLYHRVNGSGWTASAPLTGNEGTFNVNAAAEQGLYEFYTIAVDNAGNTQTTPTESRIKTSITYDGAAPESTCSLNHKTETEVYIDFQAEDNVSDVVEVQLWYRIAFGEWKLYGPRGAGLAGTFCFIPRLGDGVYEFYTIAVDGAGNVEAIPDVPDHLEVYVDLEAPSSFCISPAITTDDEIRIEYHATEVNNGIASCTLYYRFGGGVTWSTITSRTAAKGVIQFRMRDGDGRYEFQTIAEDEVGRREEKANDVVDSVTLLDREAPISWCTTTEFEIGTEIDVTFEATDNVSGVDRVKLFYCYNGGEFVDTGLTSDDAAGTFSFDVSSGDGEYAFYTIAIDNAGHRERVPNMPDAVTVVDTQLPVSVCSCPVLTNTPSVDVSFVAGDERADPVHVTLWYTFNNGPAANTGLSMTAGTGLFTFELSRGEGLYGFFTIAEDTAGNVELDKDPECEILYDATPPVSECSVCAYATKSPLSIPFSAEDPDVSWLSEGSGVTGVSLWYRYKMYVDQSYGEWQNPGIRMAVSQGTFSFWAREGEGFYQFMSRADDKAGNLEPMKTDADCGVVYDVTPPSSYCNSPEMVTEPRINVSFAVSEITSGIDRTTLWYRYAGDYSGSISNQPDISVSPAYLDFGQALVGADKNGQVSVQNLGSSPLIVSGIEVVGSPAGTFYETQHSANWSFTVLAGGSQTVNLRFHPSSVGVFTHYLNIYSNDPDETTFTVTLRGEGTSSAGGPDIRLSHSLYNFGSVLVGYMGRGIAKIRIYNDGGQALVVQEPAISFSPSYAPVTFMDADVLEWPRTVQPGAYTDHNIYFLPQAVQSFTGTTTINSNDPDESSVRVSLQGEGRAFGGSEPILWSNIHDSHDFGEVALNSSTDLEVRLTNTGSRDLVIYYAGFSSESGTWPEGDNMFADTRLAGQYPLTIAAGQTDSIVIRFTPTETGELHDIVNIPTNEMLPGYMSIELYGTGVVTQKRSSAFAELEAAGFTQIHPSSMTLSENQRMERGAAATRNGEDNGFTTTRLTRKGYSGEFTFRPRDGYGMYEFYTIAVDLAGNVERAPIYADCQTLYAADEPDIRLDRDEIDFGTMPPGMHASVYVEAFNDGLRNLVIDSTDIQSAALGAYSVPSPTFPLTIPPGNSDLIEVEFSPQGIGTFTGTLTINSNDPDSPALDVLLTGDAAMGFNLPSISVDSTSLMFGNVPVGESRLGVVTVSNTGDAALVIYSFRNQMMNSPYRDGRTNSWYPHVVEPHGSAQLRVYFEPTSVGSYAATFSIYHNDFDLAHQGKTDIACWGTGTSASSGEPNISVTPDSLDFGEVRVGTSPSKSVTVSNIGDAPLTITGMVTIGTQTAYTDGQVGTWYPHELEPGDSTQMARVFTPTEVTSYPGRFGIVSDDPDTPTYRVATTGTGVASSSGPEIRLDRSMIDFGDLPIPSLNSETFTIFNDGDADLLISSMYLESGGGVTPFMGNLQGSFTIEPSGSHAVEIHCNPGTWSPGEYTDAVVIESNDADEPQIKCDLRANLVTQGDPDIRLERDSLDYGPVVVDTTVYMYFYIYNEGTGDLVIDHVDVQQDGAAFDAGATGIFHQTVSPGDYHSLHMSFTPPEVGSFQGTLRVFSNDPDESIVFASLAGEGVDASANGANVAVPGSINFGTARVYVSKPFNLQVGNTGTTDLYIYRFTVHGDDRSAFEVGNDRTWFPHTVAPGGHATITLTFTPDRVGQFSGYAVIVTNDPDTYQVRIEIAAEGVETRGPEMNLLADKPTVHTGEDISLSLEMQNQGSKLSVDLLGAVVLPDGSYLFYPGFSGAPQPVYFTLQGNASVGPMEILRVTNGDFLPKGRYWFYVAAINPYSYEMEIESDIASATWVFE